MADAYEPSGSTSASMVCFQPLCHRVAPIPRCVHLLILILILILLIPILILILLHTSTIGSATVGSLGGLS